jgi:FKBP-type peptidyl-prolyl cis-trans isomerase FkpA
MVTTMLLLGACTEKETPKGVKYTVVTKGDGKVAEKGEVVVLNVSIRDSKDSTWFDSKRYGMPEMVMIRDDSFKNSEFGIMELFRLVSAGDSVTMTVSARDFFESTWKTAVPPEVDPLSPFTFYVKTTAVLDSMTAIKMRDSVENERRAKYDREMAEQAAGQIGLDTTMIDDHLRSLNVKAKTTKSGLRYVIKKTGKGPMAVDGQMATMKYRGYLLNGTEFDKGEYSFAVGEGGVIPGWDEIATLMNKGTSLTVYIPSTLAYGNQRRSEEILENSILVFDMELLDVKNQ